MRAASIISMGSCHYRVHLIDLMPLAEVEVVCLQARRVAGLPPAVDQVELACHHLVAEPPVRVRASSVPGGEADFHGAVLLLHCYGAAATSAVVTVSVSSCRGQQQQQVGVFPVDLGERRPALSFVLGGAAAGAVLTLALHRRLVRPPRTSCLPLPRGCCRWKKRPQQGYESDGFITIEKQGRLATSDDQSSVEEEFLAMLELDSDDFDLDTLVKDAEAELLKI